MDNLAHLESEVKVVPLENRVHLDLQDLQARGEREGLKDPQAQMVDQGQQDHKENVVLKERLVLQEALVSEDEMDLLVNQAHKDQLALQVRPVSLDHLVQLAQQDQEAKGDSVAQQERLVVLDNQDVLDLLDLLDQRDQLVRQEKEVLGDLLVKVGQEDLLDLLAAVGNLVLLEDRALLVLVAKREKEARLEVQVCINWFTVRGKVSMDL